MYDEQDLEVGPLPETGYEAEDDPVDEAPFTAAELLRLARELLVPE